MKPSTLEALIWVLIYGGLLIASLSIFVFSRSGLLGTTLAVAGSLSAITGVVLIVVRSRMNGPH